MMPFCFANSSRAVVEDYDHQAESLGRKGREIISRNMCTVTNHEFIFHIYIAFGCLIR